MPKADHSIRVAGKRAPAVLALFCALQALFVCSVLAETHTVTVLEYRFQPDVLHIKTGDTVRWFNAEKRTSHSVRLPAEGGVESERFFPGESWSMHFERAGDHAYQCGPHPEMKGRIVVED